jgi:hypothetical protein
MDPTSDRIIAGLVEANSGKDFSLREEAPADSKAKKESAGRQRRGAKSEKAARADRQPSASRDGVGESVVEHDDVEEIPGPKPVAAASPRKSLAANALVIGLIALAFLTAVLALMYP